VIHAAAATVDRWILPLPRLSTENDLWRNTMSIQRALVIGAGSGVGQATVLALTAAGAEVVGPEPTDADWLVQLVAISAIVGF
jgi:NADPH:quinone reductase-like Zn-dependent oxidoreductase